jgi:hypothetical protein
VAESHLKESRDVHRSHRPNMHVIESYSNSSNNESKECNVDEFIWPMLVSINSSLVLVVTYQLPTPLVLH